MRCLHHIGLVTGLIASALSSSPADTYSFIGADNALWTDSASWNPSWTTPPQPFADTVFVNNGNTVVYDSSTDFQIGAGSLTVSGAGSEWSQTSTGWVKIGSVAGSTGTLSVMDGAAFNVGTAGRLYVGYNDFSTSGANGQAVLGAGSSMSLVGFALTGTTSTFDSSGALTLTDDLRVRDSSVFTMLGGTISGTLISFDLGQFGSSPVNTGRINLTAGAMSLSSPFSFDGLPAMYRAPGADAYINFTLNSAASLLFTNQSAGELDIFAGAIRYNGIAYDATNYTDVFVVTHPSASETLITVVPEPSVVALLAAAGVGALVFRRRLGAGAGR
jgi:hypothetical protein